MCERVHVRGGGGEGGGLAHLVPPPEENGKVGLTVHRPSRELAQLLPHEYGHRHGRIQADSDALRGDDGRVVSVARAGCRVKRLARDRCKLTCDRKKLWTSKWRS